MVDLLIGICWFIFTCIWVVYARKAKKNIAGNDSEPVSFARIIFIIIAISVIVGTKRFFSVYSLLTVTPFVQWMGVAVCGSGIAFAAWARIHLGRNWGMPMSIKEQPELVSSGPYRFVRHPIYTGILAAMLGSAAAADSGWPVSFMLSAIYFFYSAKKEEKLMLLRFPGEYPLYMQRTKMLIPFIF